MEITKLLEDHSIPYATEHKNVRSNWIGIDCPFCPGEPNYHLGYSLDENYFSCWRCGGHSIPSTISKLLGVSTDKALSIIEQYGGESTNTPEVRVRVGTTPFKLPSGDLTLHSHHKRYLEKRNFDWEYLQEEWDITGTGPFAILDNINYSRRILAPIYWNNRMVSYQTRDITGKHEAKYMACPPEREIISHKEILYGIPELWGSRGVCVEGITDVWRLGPQAFATFGIKYTMEQVLVIAYAFEEVVILYDPEKQAQRQAKQLLRDLEGKGVKAWIEKIDVDPGDLSQEDANHLMMQML